MTCVYATCRENKNAVECLDPTAFINVMVEQNLANEPAVSVFFYAPPKQQHLTTAFLAAAAPPAAKHSLPENPKS